MIMIASTALYSRGYAVTEQRARKTQKLFRAPQCFRWKIEKVC